MVSTEILDIAEAIIRENQIEERHSFFQLKYFNVGKECTIQGRIWQCLREIKVRKKNIEALDFEIEETKDKLELLDIEKARFDLLKNDLVSTNKELSDLNLKEANIRQRQIKRKFEALTKTLEEIATRKKYQNEELKFFVQEFYTLNKLEEVKPLDDFEAQKQYWNERIALQITLCSLLRQPIGLELIQTALSLPDDAPIKVKMLKELELSAMIQNKVESQGRIGENG